VTATPRTLGRRLAPLMVAMALQGLILWVPVEKLFLSEIGFTPASVGVMAAAYAAVVPLLEVPSGVLADRWSRNRIMVLACVALIVSSTIGGVSRNVATYVVAAMVLGAYFALSSGTVDSIVYDTVLEETGSSELYERWIGRVRMVESGGFVVSALAGGVLAEITSARTTYFATLPFAAAAIVAFLRFDEPRLHRAGEASSLRSHIALTYRTIARRRDVLRVLLLSALIAMLSQAVFEFGPLWLVALAAPAVLFGPYWAALMSTLGIGGYLATRVDVNRTWVAVALAVLAPATTVTLALTRSLAAAIVAQTVLALLLAVVAISAGKLLHDAVPSTIRAGVSSGAGTASWLFFLPFSLALGWLGREQGVPQTGWVLTGASVLVGALLVVSTRLAPPAPAEPDLATTPVDLACQELVDQVTDLLDGVLPPGWRDGVGSHLADCDGCTEYVRQIRATVDALGSLPAHDGPRAAASD
jgi:predicted MFS family arabinose efflux permease